MRTETLIWGLVRTSGEKYYLLKEEPENPFHNPSWQPKNTLRWLVCSSTPDSRKTEKTINAGGYEIYKPVYNASYLMFDQSISIEMFNDPRTMIFVDYFESESVGVSLE